MVLVILGREAPTLEIIEKRTFRDVTVNLDGTLFVSCVFENCALAYNGGRCEWENCKFSNCRITLNGAAGNTLQILEALGVVCGLKHQLRRFETKQRSLSPGD